MKKLLLCFPILLLAISVVSCSGNDDTSEEQNQNETPILTPELMTIGGIGPGGGRIFYLDNSNQHGMEVSAIIGQVPWGTSSVLYNISGLENAIGTGKDNTDKIINYFGNGNYAAKLCADFVKNGKDDWYLPSKDEVIKIYSYYKNGPACLDCFSIFENIWSSSVKYSTDFNGHSIIQCAWSINFGGISSNYPESVIICESTGSGGGMDVRAVRSF